MTNVNALNVCVKVRETKYTYSDYIQDKKHIPRSSLYLKLRTQHIIKLFLLSTSNKREHLRDCINAILGPGCNTTSRTPYR